MVVLDSNFGRFWCLALLSPHSQLFLFMLQRPRSKTHENVGTTLLFRVIGADVVENGQSQFAFTGCKSYTDSQGARVTRSKRSILLGFRGFALGLLWRIVCSYIFWRLLFCNHMVMSVHMSIGNNGEYEKTKLLVQENSILKL